MLAAAQVKRAYAISYNESNPAAFGVESFQDYVPLSYTYGPLKLTGFAFGRTGTSTTFDSWSSTVSCNSASGFGCVQLAIQSATYGAANGVAVNSNQGNLVNTILITKNNGGNSGYYSQQDVGQGPSCNTNTDDPYAQQSGSCSNTMKPGSSPPTNAFTFATRGIKVTCKSTCGQHNSIDVNNWNSLIANVAQALRSNNYFASRFVVERISSPNFAIARCRVTVPNIAQFGMDQCPDSIPAWGNQAYSADSVNQ